MTKRADIAEYDRRYHRWLYHLLTPLERSVIRGRVYNEAIRDGLTRNQAKAKASSAIMTAARARAIGRGEVLTDTAARDAKAGAS